MYPRLGRALTFTITMAMILQACQPQRGSGMESEPTPEAVATEQLVESIAVTAIANVATETPLPELEMVKADTEMVFLSGQEFEKKKNEFMHDEVAIYDDESGTLLLGQKASEIGFTPLAFNRFVVNGQPDGRMMALGMFDGGRQGFMIQDEVAGGWTDMYAVTHVADEAVYATQGIFVDRETMRGPVGLGENALHVPVFVDERDPVSGETVRFIYYDAALNGHEITKESFGGKMAMPIAAEPWFLKGLELINESEVLEQANFVWNEETLELKVVMNGQETRYLWDEEKTDWVVDSLAGFPPEVRVQVEAGQWKWDGDKKIAYVGETGAVQGYMGLDGKWYPAPEGMVQIPAGDGSGAEPFNIPGYKTMSDLLRVAINELQWGEPLARPYNEQAVKYQQYVLNTFLNPLGLEYIGKTTFRRMDQPGKPSYLSFSSYSLPGGVLVAGVNYSQAEIVMEPNFSNVRHIVWEDPKALLAELERIDQCVQQNAGASDLAELCQSDMIDIPDTGETQ